MRLFVIFLAVIILAPPVHAYKITPQLHLCQNRWPNPNMGSGAEWQVNMTTPPSDLEADFKLFNDPARLANVLDTAAQQLIQICEQGGDVRPVTSMRIVITWREGYGQATISAVKKRSGGGWTFNENAIGQALGNRVAAATNMAARKADTEARFASSTPAERQWLVSQEQRCYAMRGALNVTLGGWNSQTTVECHWDPRHPDNQSGLNALDAIRHDAERRAGEYRPLFRDVYAK